MYQILEYFALNPQASAAQVIDYFAQEMQIPQQIKYLMNENADTLQIRRDLKPLYAEKRDLQEEAQIALSEIETAVMSAYPPRQGSEAKREELRAKLKSENEPFQVTQAKLRVVLDGIYELEEALAEVDRNAKNARRLVDLHTAYTLFIRDYTQTRF